MPSTGEIPISQILAVLWQRRVAVLSILCLGLGLGLGALAIIPPRYETQALLLIEPSTLRPGDELLQDGQDLADSAAIDSEVRILRSSLLAQDIAGALDLDDDARFLKATGGGESDLAGAVRRLMVGLDIERDGNTRVIAVRFKSHDPYVSARIANAVAERYIVGQLARKYESTRYAADFLGKQTAKSEADLAAAKAAQDAFRAKAGPLLAGDGGVQGIEISRLKGEAVAAAAEYAARRAKLSRLQTLVGRVAGAEAFEAMGGSGVLESLFRQKNEALRRESELLAQYGERHPRILDIRAEIKEIDPRIAQEQRALLGRLEAGVAEARARQATIEDELARLKTQTSAATDARGEGERLAREVAAKRDLHEALIRRVEALTRIDQVQRPDARVISEATVPPRPSFPNPIVFLGLAFTSSLTSGVLFAFLLEGRERGFRRPDELEAELERPCLGSLPLLPNRRGTLSPWRQVTEAPDDLFAETLRGVVAELRLERRDAGKVLMLASATKGEGAAAIALSLARAASLSGARVLLIESRLREPCLAEQLELEPGYGLTEVLVEGQSLSEAIVHDHAVVPPLALLPAGQLGDIWPTRLFGPDGMPVLLEGERRRHDLILISAPPVLEQAEARALAHLVDGVVLAVAFRRTSRDKVRLAVDLLARAGGRLEGSLLNFVDPNATSGYRNPGRA